MTETITDKDEIGKIINENIKGKKIKLTKHYRIRAAWRGITDEKVLEVLPQFDKVIEIERKKLKFGDIGYELFYDMSNNITFSIAVSEKRNNIYIIRAIEYKRNLARRFSKN